MTPDGALPNVVGVGLVQRVPQKEKGGLVEVGKHDIEILLILVPQPLGFVEELDFRPQHRNTPNLENRLCLAPMDRRGPSIAPHSSREIL